MNHTVGKIGAGLTGLAVLCFAVSMIFGFFTDTLFFSCLSSMFIAIGFVPLICALAALNEQRKAVGYAAVAFAAVYATIIMLVYFAQVTTVRMNASLSAEALSIISYGQVGSLFFNYDLLGYGFMALSTFCAAFLIAPRDKGDKALQLLLYIHGVFFLSGLIVPMLPVFTEGSGGSDLMGTLVLEFWCAYFLPVCILAYRYFARAAQKEA
jgi:hypothetical protein